MIAVDLPFGVRTDHDLPELYGDLSDALREGVWDRFVGITTSPGLLDLEPTRTVDLRYGRLDATIVIVRR